MMSNRTTVRFGSVTLGEGRPKVCVPLFHADVEGLRRVICQLPDDTIDLVEWRIDYFDDVADDAAVRAALADVRGALPLELPLLLTFRTLAEGGQREITFSDYERLLLLAIASGQVDAIDVEMFMPTELVARVVEKARASGVVVVMSSHDFTGTPPHDEIVGRLHRQQEMGADVVKIAVMPHLPRDVITLLDATESFVSQPGTVPAITMSMGSLGVISRLSGESLGSCLTFGALETAAAPGQMDVCTLRHLIDTLHKATSGA